MTITDTETIPERITFDTLECYVLSEVSDSGSIRIYRCEDDWELAVIEGTATAPTDEVRTTWECWTPAGDVWADEDIVRENGVSATRTLARRR